MISIVNLHARDNGECRYCRRETLPPGRQYPKKEGLAPSRDHLVPLSKNGPKGQQNIVLACRDCNDLKGDLTEQEFADVVAYMIDQGIEPMRGKNGRFASLKRRILQCQSRTPTEPTLESLSTSPSAGS